VDYGCYVRLDEYNGKEGLIHISEISSTWVKNIREHVREGEKLVLKVLRVNPQRGQIDLSLRRVTGREKVEKMLQWKMERKAESIVKAATEKLKADVAAAEKIKEKILENYGNLYDAFEEAVEKGEEVFIRMGVNSDWARALADTARLKIKIKRARAKATIELTCMKHDGIDAIKTALLNARGVKEAKGAEVKIYTIGAPKYRIEVVAKDYNDADKTLKGAIREALSTIKNLGGEGRLLS
jgi:translation initiation factor 2 subunit 1